ncbi:DUF1851 domain-containing protein [Pseudomonas asturiensis]|uniref:DUF1851 domain-containing protein n=1 Tax=Pseudomonas asturiensis TaxID=1190415 RepID=A0ABX6HIU0_9PSED|nr:GAD-like domain-containing protein [Pseudomonas asturiensis]QHF05530.1 DUF1851 domain-containing protein [Pseudomonas asturiensis]
MDEDYAYFVKNFGTPVVHEEASESSIAHYKGKLPKRLLDYWSEYGWCGYASGIFWVVNPQPYEDILDQWLAGTEIYGQDNYHVIARGAFGLLYVWGERKGHCLTISSLMGRFSSHTSNFTGDKLDVEASVFFSCLEPEQNDLIELFRPAVETLGTLKSDEMYAFVPALALGGSMELKNLQKVKTIEHLEFLSQLSPLQDWGFPEV